jgi:GNAT superfamily N-acetyltransferase
MADIGRYRPDDRRAIEALYRRVFGHDAAEANRLKWDWQHRSNPASADGLPLIWVAREGTNVVGQLAAIPVRVVVRGQEVDGAWGTDAMVTPERRRQGLGELLLRQWDTSVGVALGLGLSESSAPLLRKLRWSLVTVPCLVKPLTRRALRMPNWSVTANRLVSALTLPFVKVVGRVRPLAAEVHLSRRFDDAFTELWERVAPRLDLAVRRDAAYLAWKFATPPYARYTIAILRRGDRDEGYVVYRHVHEPLGRATLIVDFLVDPDDDDGLRTLLGWVDREARAADSDKVRCFALHAGFRRQLRRAGYFAIKSSLELVVKVNALDVPASFYEQTDRWHVTLGDSDYDR